MPFEKYRAKLPRAFDSWSRDRGNYCQYQASIGVKIIDCVAEKHPLNLKEAILAVSGGLLMIIDVATICVSISLGIHPLSMTLRIGALTV